VIRQAERFANRLTRASNDFNAQIRTAYALTFSRSPSDLELKELAAHARKHGLPSTCRLIFNCNEFSLSIETFRFRNS